MNENTTGSLSQRTTTRCVARFLRTAQWLMQAAKFAATESQPRNSGLSATFRRYESFPVVTAPVVEGVTPPGITATYTDVVMRLNQHVNVVYFTDRLKDTHEDPVVKKFTEGLGKQAAEIVETLLCDMLKGGSNVSYAGAVGSRLLVARTVNLGDIQRCVRTLKRAGAKKHGKMIAASQNVATQPVDAAFFAFCHPDLEPDLYNIREFIKAKNYADPGKKIEGEIGEAGGVRFIGADFMTPFLNATTATSTKWLSGGDIVSSAATSDVYPIVITAEDSYAALRLQGMEAAEILTVQPHAAPGDPAGQRGSIASKFYFGCGRLNEAWMFRLEVLCTANPEG